MKGLLAPQITLTWDVAMSLKLILYQRRQGVYVELLTLESLCHSMRQGGFVGGESLQFLGPKKQRQVGHEVHRQASDVIY